MALLVKRLTLDFGSGHDLTVWETEPLVGSVLTVQTEPAWDSLSPSLSAPAPLMRTHGHTLSFKTNK